MTEEDLAYVANDGEILLRLLWASVYDRDTVIVERLHCYEILVF